MAAMARARSAAVMPVFADTWSTGTVKAVPSGAELAATIIGRSSRWATSGRIDRQS